MTARCTFCCVVWVVIMAMFLGAGLYLLCATDHSTAGGWMLALSAATLLLYSCRRSCFTAEEWAEWAGEA